MQHTSWMILEVPQYTLEADLTLYLWASRGTREDTPCHRTVLRDLIKSRSGPRECTSLLRDHLRSLVVHHILLALLSRGHRRVVPIAIFQA